MAFRNYDDVENQLLEAGLILDRDLNYDAKIQRWKVKGEDSERRGWSRLKEWTSPKGHSYIVGCYGVWHGNDDGYTKIEFRKDDVADELSAADKAAIKAAQKASAEAIKKERQREADTAATWASLVWSRCVPVESQAQHEYLQRKQIQPHGVRLLGDVGDLELPGIDSSNIYRLKAGSGALVIPMHDQHGNVCGLQFVYPRGHERAKKIERDKEFWPSGMAMGGTFGIIGPIHRNGIALVCEGYATGATLHEATGQSVVYAFSANNLIKAGKALRRQFPALRLMFCADDDYLTQGNPGVSEASNASAMIERSAWMKPDFVGTDGEDRRGGKKLTDFNDLAILTGLPIVVATQVNAALDSHKWRESASLPSPGGASGGGSNSGSGEARRGAVSVMLLDDAVARFVPLDDGTGKYLFDLWTNRVVLRDQMTALLPAGVRGDDVKRHPVWVQRGAFYLDQVGFDPSGKDKMVKLNTWRGWPLEPAAGECQRLLNLLHYLCSGDADGDRVYKWLLCWMAYPLQNPGAKMSSAVIMHGPQGTGKSAVFQTLAKIYGDYATVLNQRGLEDKFNSDWADSKLFILAEEVVTRAEMHHIKNELKELVTGEWIRVNPKNVAAYRQRNQVNIVYLSNEDQPLPIENDDRRHLVVYTPAALPASEYDDLFREIENGGIAAFYHFLLNLDLGDFHPKKHPPMTEAKRELIRLSMSSEDRFVEEWKSGEAGFPFVPCSGRQFYTAYAKWCRWNGVRYQRESNYVLNRVGRLPGWSNKARHIYENTHYTGQTKQQRIIWPPDLEPPAHKTQSQWLTDCFFDMQNALGGDL